jgi:Fe(3+) dicitrate transport protein
MDFSNQIIPVAESAGGVGFGVVNAGATRHQGIETAIAIDISQLLSSQKWSILYDLNLTYIDAYFSEDRFVSDVNINRNSTPYAPEWLLSSSISVESTSGFGARLTANSIGTQFADELNTVEPSMNGRIGEIPSYFMIDAVMSYKVARWNSNFNLSVKNITDERYISTRRPQGIRVGLPRLVTAGFEFRF